MIPRFGLLLVGAALAAAIETVPEVKVDKYLGRWYQMYTDGFNSATFERGAVCATADYGKSSTGLSVHNSENVKTVDGPVKDIDGSAVIPDPSKPGQLKVSLDGVPVAADYWIVALGPESYGKENLYEWAIVTDRHQISLFILARDAQEFESRFEDEVLKKTKALGFDGFVNKPHKIQQDGCTYEGHDPSSALFYYSSGLSTVESVDIKDYVGRWYQVYSNRFVTATFERGGYCPTADYSEIQGGVTVHNAQNQDAPDGELKVINGKATVTDVADPGKLVVRFDSVPFPGSYWIIKLGPKGRNGQYQYSVVTDADSRTLFILARSPSVFASQYESEVLDFVKQQGFTGAFTKPVKSYQGSDCAYESEAVQQSARFRTAAKAVKAARRLA